jgi:hypothetical protein
MALEFFKYNPLDLAKSKRTAEDLIKEIEYFEELFTESYEKGAEIIQLRDPAADYKIIGVAETQKRIYRSKIKPSKEEEGEYELMKQFVKMIKGHNPDFKSYCYVSCVCIIDEYRQNNIATLFDMAMNKRQYEMGYKGVYYVFTSPTCLKLLQTKGFYLVN